MNKEKEIIIKSKKRVQKHGEVFTPKRIVNMMLDQPGIKEACESVEQTFLEPSAGEGAFLIEILKRKLELVQEKYNSSLKEYENYSLLALTSLYGIELLEDNAQRCTMNMYKVYNDYYRQVATNHEKKPRESIFKAAQYIISSNIVQGDFLTKKQANEEPIVFSEWQWLNADKHQKQVTVQRTEYTLQDISEGVIHTAGYIHGNPTSESIGQLSLFDMFEDTFTDEQESIVYQYVECPIAKVYLEEMEEADESHRD